MLIEELAHRLRPSRSSTSRSSPLRRPQAPGRGSGTFPARWRVSTLYKNSSIAKYDPVTVTCVGITENCPSCWESEPRGHREEVDAGVVGRPREQQDQARQVGRRRDELLEAPDLLGRLRRRGLSRLQLLKLELEFLLLLLGARELLPRLRDLRLLRKDEEEDQQHGQAPLRRRPRSPARARFMAWTASAAAALREHVLRQVHCRLERVVVGRGPVSVTFVVYGLAQPCTSASDDRKSGTVSIPEAVTSKFMFPMSSPGPRPATGGAAAASSPPPPPSPWP